jgi:hypothetical protein
MPMSFDGNRVALNGVSASKENIVGCCGGPAGVGPGRKGSGTSSGSLP